MDIALNWVAIFTITTVSFFFGAAWHGKLFFGNIWMQIHHGEAPMNDAEMKKAMEGIWKLMLPEFISTLLMVTTLDFLLHIISSFSPFHIAFLVWIGFVLPSMVSTVIWGGDARKWMAPKILISGSFHLISLLLSAYILSIW